MSLIATVDFETRSTVELKRTGVYPYAAHRDTFIWCMAWAFGDDEPSLWAEGDPFPAELAEHIAGGGAMYAHNAAFERRMWQDCARKRYGFPEVKLEQWFCTAAEAAVMSLPRQLDMLARVLRLPAKKDAEGARLMMRMCRPRKLDDATGDPVWWDEPARRERLYAYCKQDVRVEQMVYHKLRRLNARERAIYLHHEVINDRGVPLDRALAGAVRTTADAEIMRQNKLLEDATGGAVTEVTKVASIKAWLETQDLDDSLYAGTLNKAALREMLLKSDSLSPEVLTALTARSEAGKSSLAKIDAMFDVAGPTDRMRGLLMYHGAGTGRATGKHVQPHNFPRGTAIKDFSELLRLVEAALAGKLPDLLPPDVSLMTACSALLRPMLAAPAGSIFVCGDFKAIEARVLPWIAGQEDLVQAFFNGANLYADMGAVIYDRPASEIIKGTDDYTVSKNTVLGCGFQMGWKRFMSQLYEQAGVVVSEELAKKAVNAYRERYTKIVDFWTDVNAAAIAAVREPGSVQRAGKVKFAVRDGYLMIVLPAGRSLTYAAPTIVERPTPWGEYRDAVEFSGFSGYTHQWERLALYGGLITENIVQAIARDLLMDAALRTEAAGFPTVLTVHDEIVAELPSSADDAARFDEFSRLMKVVPTWAKGCPVDVEGWHGRRYRK